ncbi:MAG: sucrase ferredoxin [Tetrasphaera sp.]|nr:sucrase ferredoxin [Tetrasphaera sp.]
MTEHAKEPPCATRARERGDDLAGTASRVRAFLLLEEPGPWGRHAWRDARLPEGLGPEMLRRCAAAGVRPLLIRREQRKPGSTRRVFTAYPGSGRVETTTVNDPRALLDLDLAALGRGQSLRLDPHSEPIFAVCTHGRHDRCCAERGRPVIAALRISEPEATWGVSHIGGDRFAGNLLVLGEGLYYGRLDPAAAVRVAAQHRAGRLDLDHFRGRCTLPTGVQAAEIQVRRELGLGRFDAVVLDGRRRLGESWQVRFVTDSGPVHVTSRPRTAGTARLTCAATLDNPVIAWDCELVSEGRPVPSGTPPRG